MLYHRRSNNANRSANARATPGRERELQYHHLAYALLSTRRRERKRQQKKGDRRKKAEKRRGFRCHTRAPFVTSTLPISPPTTTSSSSFSSSPVTPNPRFFPLLSSLAHTLHTHSRIILGRCRYLQRERFDCYRGNAVPFKSIPRGAASFIQGTELWGQASLDRLRSFRPSRSDHSLPRAANFRQPGSALRRTETALRNRNKERRSRARRPWRSLRQSTERAAVSYSRPAIAEANGTSAALLTACRAMI